MPSPRPAGVIELLDRAVRLYRDHLGLALGVVALLLVPLNLFLGITLHVTLGPLFSAVQEFQRTLDIMKLFEVIEVYGGLELFLSAVLITGVYFMFYSLMAPLSTGALYLAFNAAHRGERATVLGAYRALLPVLWGFLGVVVLKGTAILLGLLLCIVPGIALALVLALAEVLATVERRGTLDAMARSRDLMLEPGSMWRMLGVFLLVIVAGLVL